MSGTLVPGGGPLSGIGQHIDNGRTGRAHNQIGNRLGLEVAETVATMQVATVKLQGLAHLGLQGTAAAELMSAAAVEAARRTPHAAPLLDRIYNAAGVGIVRVIEDAAEQVTR